MPLKLSDEEIGTLGKRESERGMQQICLGHVGSLPGLTGDPSHSWKEMLLRASQGMWKWGYPLLKCLC